MKKMILLLALFTTSAVAFAQTAVVTECEWFTRRRREPCVLCRNGFVYSRRSRAR
jgi:hypothetical protein